MDRSVSVATHRMRIRVTTYSFKCAQFVATTAFSTSCHGPAKVFAPPYSSYIFTIVLALITTNTSTAPLPPPWTHKHTHTHTHTHEHHHHHHHDHKMIVLI